MVKQYWFLYVTKDLLEEYKKVCEESPMEVTDVRLAIKKAHLYGIALYGTADQFEQLDKDVGGIRLF